MLDYLAESIIVSFAFGTMLGAFITMQLGHTKFKSIAQRIKNRD